MKVFILNGQKRREDWWVWVFSLSSSETMNCPRRGIKELMELFSTLQDVFGSSSYCSRDANMYMPWTHCAFGSSVLGGRRGVPQDSRDLCHLWGCEIVLFVLLNGSRGKVLSHLLDTHGGWMGGRRKERQWLESDCTGLISRLLLWNTTGTPPTYRE